MGMGSFANTFLRTLLGWVRVSVDSLWRLIDSRQGMNVVDWLGHNWLALAIAICAAGMVIDGVVHWFRWRPYEVWKSYFRRVGMGERTEKSGQKLRRWVYADGSDVVEQVEAPNEAEDDTVRSRAGKLAQDGRRRLAAFLTEDELADQPISYKPAAPARDKNEVFGKPVYPTNWKTQNNNANQ